MHRIGVCMDEFIIKSNASTSEGVVGGHWQSHGDSVENHHTPSSLVAIDQEHNGYDCAFELL